MVTKDRYNILFIKDGLEPYEENLTLEQEDILFCDVFADDLASFDTSLLNREKSKFLIITDIAVYNSDKHKKLLNYCSEKLSINMPFFLVLTRKPLDEDMKTSIEKDLNFHYLIPGTIEPDEGVFNYNFNCFIKLVFKELLHVVRLNSYIVDSFENIIDTQVIRQQKEQIEELNEELDRISRIDPLTNLLNRRAFYAELDKMDDDDNFSSMLIDIDFFKKVNDTYGHQSGDDVLRHVGRLLSSNEIFREQDIIARYGGEEFIIVLPYTRRDEALLLSEKLREAIKTVDFYDDREQAFRVTMSIGIAQYDPEHDIDHDSLFARTDKALYFAKQNGRDRSIFYDDVFSR